MNFQCPSGSATFRTYACRFGYNLDNDTIKIYGVIKHPSYLYLCCCDYNYINNTVSNYKVTNITSVEIRKRYSYDCGISSMKIEPFPSACTLNKVIIVIKYSKSYSSDDDTGYAGIVNMDNGTITALDDQNLWGADWQRNHFLTQIQWSPNGKYCTIGRVLRYAIILHFSNDYSSYSTVKSTVNLNLMGLAIMDNTKFIFENKVYTFSNPSTALYTLPFTIESYCICIGNKCFNKATDTTIKVYDIEDDTFTLSKTIDILNQNLFITSGYVGESSFTFNSSNYQLGSYHISDKGELMQLQAKGVTLYNTENAKNISTGNVLSGKKYYDMNGLCQGTMPNNGALNFTPTASQQTIAAGYTSGGTIKSIEASLDYSRWLAMLKTIQGTTSYVKNGLVLYHNYLVGNPSETWYDVVDATKYSTRTVTPVTLTDNGLYFSGGAFETFNINQYNGTYEMYVKIPKFSISGNGYWRNMPCLFGIVVGYSRAYHFGAFVHSDGYIGAGAAAYDTKHLSDVYAFDDKYHHIVFTIESNKYYKLYIDDVLKQSWSDTASISGSVPTKIGIMRAVGTTLSARGYVKDFRIYNRVLSASEVHTNYLSCTD